MAANNETGVIQPLVEITKHVRDAGALLLVDAVQAAGKIDPAVDADYLTLSAHKLGGPQGAGALVVKAGAPYASLISGGGQERGKRGGTENVAAIAGFGAVAAIAVKREDAARLAALRDRFEAELLRRVPQTIVFGAGAGRLGNTSNFALPAVAAETALMALDLDGVMVSSGSACSSGKVRPSPVLKAMGVADDVAVRALRVSFGWNSTDADVDAALGAIEKFVARAHPRVAA
jgi:cysteine desulfurase